MFPELISQVIGGKIGKESSFRQFEAADGKIPAGNAFLTNAEKIFKAHAGLLKSAPIYFTRGRA